jgi:hypothetical protein
MFIWVQAQALISLNRADEVASHIRGNGDVGQEIGGGGEEGGGTEAGERAGVGRGGGGEEHEGGGGGERER